MRILVAVLAAMAIAAGEAGAQEPAAPGGAQSSRLCRLVMGNQGVAGATGGIINLQDPFEVICTDGSLVRANSGVVDQATRIVTLTENVYFEDLTRTLTSERAVYEINQGRLYATGNVVFIDRVEGTTLRGPELEYFRAMEGRPEALVNASGRSHLTLRRQRNADGPPSESAAAPLEVDADFMTIVGQDNLTAIGNVLIQDENMRAVADEAEHRGVSETMELRGNSEIHSREYSLTGETIFARLPEGSLQEVEARGRARLIGEELNVSAPKLDLLFESDLLQRAVAMRDTVAAPGQRPVATSPTFRLRADSIDATLPGQSLRTVVAIGNARGETIDTTAVADSADAGAVPGDSLPAASADGAMEALSRLEEGDSLPPAGALELVANDWIVGDTITGFFVAAPTDSAAAAADTASAPAEGVPGDPDQPDPLAAPVAGAEPVAAGSDSTVVLERLVALGAARSLYHVAPEAGSPPGTRPGINFLSAAMIELTFKAGQVDVANVEGLRRGLYLEPLGTDPQAEAAADGDAEPGAEAETPDPATEENGAGNETIDPPTGVEPGRIE